MKYSIKELRARHNLTQKQLADKIGVSVLAVIQWERGGNITLSNLNKLCKALDVEIEDLKLWEI